jgi:hypothetical protein
VDHIVWESLAYETIQPSLELDLEYVSHNYEDKGALRRTSQSPGRDLPPGCQKSFQNVGTELRRPLRGRFLGYLSYHGPLAVMGRPITTRELETERFLVSMQKR